MSLRFSNSGKHLLSRAGWALSVPSQFIVCKPEWSRYPSTPCSELAGFSIFKSLLWEGVSSGLSCQLTLPCRYLATTCFFFEVLRFLTKYAYLALAFFLGFGSLSLSATFISLTSYNHYIINVIHQQVFTSYPVVFRDLNCIVIYGSYFPCNQFYDSLMQLVFVFLKILPVQS